MQQRKALLNIHCKVNSVKILYKSKNIILLQLKPLRTIKNIILAKSQFEKDMTSLVAIIKKFIWNKHKKFKSLSYDYKIEKELKI